MPNRYLTAETLLEKSQMIAVASQVQAAFATEEIIDDALTMAEAWIDQQGTIIETGVNFARDIEIVALRMTEAFWVAFKTPESRAVVFLAGFVQESTGDYSISVNPAITFSRAEEYCRQLIKRHLAADGSDVMVAGTDVFTSTRGDPRQTDKRVLTDGWPLPPPGQSGTRPAVADCQSAP